MVYNHETGRVEPRAEAVERAEDTGFGNYPPNAAVDPFTVPGLEAPPDAPDSDGSLREKLEALRCLAPVEAAHRLID